ncbi:transposase [uncultured Ruegeria sp.]|uniref:IS110 family transposase n=1 Tax=uncultured Ruegeria sp. TaxID=259304 RepID=UPI00345B60B7
MQIKRIGLDLAKYVFEVHAVGVDDEVVLQKTLRRDAVAQFFAELSPCIVGMEACCGSHYWARVLTELGHEVRLISPQFVKPYVKSNKNDWNDAEAICEAVGRPSMRFVPPKSAEQLEIQAVHRIRGDEVEASGNPSGLAATSYRAALRSRIYISNRDLETRTKQTVAIRRGPYTSTQDIRP